MKIDLIYRGYTIKNSPVNDNAYRVNACDTGVEIFTVMEEEFTSVDDIQTKIDKYKKENK